MFGFVITSCLPKPVTRPPTTGLRADPLQSLITLWDVIQHVISPLAVSAKLFRLIGHTTVKSLLTFAHFIRVRKWQVLKKSCQVQTSGVKHLWHYISNWHQRQSFSSHNWNLALVSCSSLHSPCEDPCPQSTRTFPRVKIVLFIPLHLTSDFIDFNQMGNRNAIRIYCLKPDWWECLTLV